MLRATGPAHAEPRPCARRGHRWGKGELAFLEGNPPSPEQVFWDTLLAGSRARRSNPRGSRYWCLGRLIRPCQAICKYATSASP